MQPAGLRVRRRDRPLARADRFREFRGATRLSFASAGAAEALANERTATTLRRLGGAPPTAGRSPRPSARSTTRCGALPRRHPASAAGRRRGKAPPTRRQLDALRLRAATGSLGLQEVVEDYGVIARGLFGIVRDLDSGRPSRATGRAADAYVALVQAVEAAEMERVTQAAALVRGTESVRVRGVIVEAGALDTFREYASRPLVRELDTVLSQPASATVDRVREVMVRDPASVQRRASLERGWPRPGRASAGCAGWSAGPPASWRRRRRRIWMRHARAPAARWPRDGVLILVADLGLLLWRSITRPLEEVSAGARICRPASWRRA